MTVFNIVFKRPLPKIDLYGNFYLLNKSLESIELNRARLYYDIENFSAIHVKINIPEQSNYAWTLLIFEYNNIYCTINRNLKKHLLRFVFNFIENI